jgi:hypothetical protein
VEHKPNAQNEGNGSQQEALRITACASSIPCSSSITTKNLLSLTVWFPIRLESQLYVLETGVSILDEGRCWVRTPEKVLVYPRNVRYARFSESPSFGLGSSMHMCCPAGFSLHMCFRFGALAIKVS